MSAADVTPHRRKYHVITYCHSFRVALKSKEVIPLLLGNRRSYNSLTVGQTLSFDKGSIRVKESDVITPLDRCYKSANREIFSRRCGNRVRNAVAIDVPRNQILIISVAVDTIMRAAYNLRIQHRLTEYECPVLIVELHQTPIIAIDNLVAVIPSREVLIPATIFFRRFNPNRDIANPFKRKTASYKSTLIEYNVFKGTRLRPTRNSTYA